ncbi:VOC family protein [Leptospira ellisii]|nr:hypothetical protein CH375_10180 [Leptospira ellisii]
MSKITPFLWFDGNLEEALNFYASIFKNSKILNLDRAGDVAVSGVFRLENQEFFALNGGPQFKFTEAVSFFVSCDTQSEIDEYWEKLSEGGQVQKCGWLKDKFVLSWQIIPPVLGEYLRDKDPVRSQRVMQAMLKMEKIDIGELKNAYDGK